jgi:hypothetical protein
MRYAILYCLWNNENVIKDVEIIKEKNLKRAIEKTDRNLEANIVIPLNSNNKTMLNKALKN